MLCRPGSPVLFADYTHALKRPQIDHFDLTNHMVIIGLFIGGLVPYSSAPWRWNRGPRRRLGGCRSAPPVQGHTPAINEGTAKPDYSARRRHATRAARSGNDLFLAAPVHIPVVIGVARGRKPLGGVLRAPSSRPVVAISMTTAAARGTPQEIHRGRQLRRQGSDAHKAAVTADTVATHNKDTAGPPVTPLIRSSNIVACSSCRFCKIGNGDKGRLIAAFFFGGIRHEFSLAERKIECKGDYYIAGNAIVIGSVVLHSNASIWWNCVVRADNDVVTIGENSQLQDGCILHVDPGFPITIGSGVSVGHMAMLHGCTIGDGSLIGIKSVILNGAKIGKNCLIGASSLIAEGKEIPDGSLVMGSPGRVVRQLSAEEIARIHRAAEQTTCEVPALTGAS